MTGTPIEPTHEPLPPGMECCRTVCNVCPPGMPWYGRGVEECYASGSCEICAPRRFSGGAA